MSNRNDKKPVRYGWRQFKARPEFTGWILAIVTWVFVLGAEVYKRWRTRRDQA